MTPDTQGNVVIAIVAIPAFWIVCLALAAGTFKSRDVWIGAALLLALWISGLALLAVAA